ncbi:Acid phosphatase 1 [Glycine soja]
MNDFRQLEVFDHEKFNNWVEKGVAPAIEPSLKLYEDVLNLGFKVILLTGRSERHRSVTVDNLINAGFKEWDQLILRRFRDKKEVAEPEADPERDQRTVFAYQMPLKATETDVYEFFSKAGKNLVQSNASGGAAGVTGPYGAVDRKLYVGNLHFNMTESQLREEYECT